MASNENVTEIKKQSSDLTMVKTTQFTFWGQFDSDIQENQRLNPNNVLKGPQKTADKCKESLVDFNNPT